MQVRYARDKFAPVSQIDVVTSAVNTRLRYPIVLSLIGAGRVNHYPGMELAQIVLKAFGVLIETGGSNCRARTPGSQFVNQFGRVRFPSTRNHQFGVRFRDDASTDPGPEVAAAPDDNYGCKVRQRASPVPMTKPGCDESQNKPGNPTEGQLFRSQLGADWALLSPNIQARFEHDPPIGTVVRYRGIMEVVQCSRWGKILAWFVQHTGALMPYEGESVPCDIEVWTQREKSDVFKKRTYHLSNRKPFVFQSRMRLDNNKKLVEFVGGGFAMFITVQEHNGNLKFTDDGYFLQIGALRLPIPRVLSPGQVYLLHENIGPTSFRITIDIRHPWYGPLYYQRGTFEHVLDRD